MMTSSGQQLQHKRLRRLAIGLGIVSALIALLAALGVFWLPGFTKSQLETRLTEMLQRPVSIAALELKLHTLELIIHDFQINDRASSPETPAPLLSFRKLHVDLSIESLKYRAPVVSAITLTNPQIRLIREANGQFNIADLLEKFTKTGDETTETSEQANQFSVSNISIHDGRIELIDRSKNSEHVVSEINLNIPAVARLSGAETGWIEPQFNAKINAAPVSLTGKLQPFTAKQEVTLDLKFNAIDIAHFKPYLSLPQGVQLLTGYYDGALTFNINQQPDQAPKYLLNGTTTLRQLTFSNNAVATPYQAGMQKLEIAFAKTDLTGATPFRVRLNSHQIALTRQGDNEPALALGKLSINNLGIHANKQRITLGDIVLDDFKASFRRDAQGAIDIAKLFSPDTGTGPEAKVTVAAASPSRIPIPLRKPSLGSSSAITAKNQPAAPATASAQATSSNKPWTPQIKSIQLNNAALRFEDLSLAKVTPMIIDSLNVSLENIDPEGANPLNLALQGQVNQHGSIKANGSLAWSPLAADLSLDLNSVDIVSLQGWLGDQLTALLTSGDVSFSGNVKAGGNPLKIEIKGQSKLANFNLIDSQKAHDLLHWKKLDIAQLDFVSDPLRVNIGAIHLGDFYARMTILPDGTLNLKQIFRQEQKAPDNVAGATAASTPPASAKNEAPIHIDKIFLQNGSIKFNDRFIKPNYHANLTALAGQIGPLYPGKSGKIDIRGMVSKTAPLQISGAIDPFSAELLLDIVAQVKDIDLPPLSPYSAKYIGYAIEKGKLSADVNYQVENGALTADNKIFLDQFTLGEKIDSEAGGSLPISLAIALLKNRRGEIDIHLPLKGSINDPDFNLGDIIFQALINLITKAITSPFSLLGSVMGGGEELSEIPFTPGFATIDEASMQRLQALSDVLKDRPSLQLEISGHFDPVNDHEGLKQAILQNTIKAHKLADDAKKGIAGGTIAQLTLTPEDYNKYLEIAYKKENFEKPKNAIGLAKSLPSAEMEQLMLAHITIHDNDLQVLAENRAIAARDWLIENGGVSGDRIFVVGSHEDTGSEQHPGSRVEFILK
ncbi:DUF748 domain-containing protein [Nitrosomonas sp.]|uniref:DUF748 domain-containing protein n=1 Tax=Nitrosomonas sp. TaxID=42353 RepID=UPI0035B33A21